MCSGGNHYSQRIVFAPDGTMFMSSGERFQFDPAQDPNSDLGKVIHMTAEGAADRRPLLHAGPPQRARARFRSGRAAVGDGDGAQRAATSSTSSCRAGTTAGRGSPTAPIMTARHPRRSQGQGFEEPKLWWNPSVSPGSLLIYTGDLFPQWKGDALIGALSGQALIRADIDGDKAEQGRPVGHGRPHPRGRPRAAAEKSYLLEDGTGRAPAEADAGAMGTYSAGSLPADPAAAGSCAGRASRSSSRRESFLRRRRRSATAR